MKVLVVIPSRYASTRFPGKPLAMLGGKMVVQWVWQRVATLPMLTKAVVATDDQRIYDAVQQFGGTVMMTSSSHRSGTDRCGEVVQRLAQQGETYDVVINVQGDEPFVAAEQLQVLCDTFSDDKVQIATLRTKITSTEELLSPNNVKVVCNAKGDALLFSRHPLPYQRGVESTEWLQHFEYYKHVGIYAFRSNVLLDLCKLQPSPLEKAESLEQLRWLDNGYSIAVRTTQYANIGIDTPHDLALAETALVNNHAIL